MIARVKAGEVGKLPRVRRKRIAGGRPPWGVHLHLGIHGGGWPQQAGVGRERRRRGIRGGGGGVGGGEGRERVVAESRRRESGGPRQD